jgi:protein TonB
MSYLDQTNGNRPRTIAAVAILHAGLGYLIVSGLAYTVITQVPRVTIAENYPDALPPPPHDFPPPPPHDTRTNPPSSNTETLVKTDILPRDTLTTVKIGPLPPPPADPDPFPRIEQPKPNLGRAVQPGAGRAGWVTSDDYPAQSLREGATGVVAISVSIASDGRVQGCEVTKSSGNTQLDEATCRLYARRARFTPALDPDGKPAVAHFADRIRWQLPAQ